MILPLVGPGRAVSMADGGTELGRAIAASGTEVRPFDPDHAWRAGTLPLVELAAAGCPEWVDSRPHGAEMLLVAELDSEAGSTPAREGGPIGETALAALLHERSGDIVAAHVVAWPTRAPTVVVLLGGGGTRRLGIDPLGETTATARAEAQSLASLEDRLDTILETRSPGVPADEAERIARAMRDAACAAGWRRAVARIPSRAALTMRALRVARRRPIALRRVPGQVARGLLRRGRKDRLVASPRIPDGLARLRAGAPVAITVVAFAESSDGPAPASAEMTGGRADARVVVLEAEPTTSAVVEALRAVDTELVVFWPGGVTAEPGVLDRLCAAMVEHASRVVGAPVGLLHLTELGLDLEQGARLADGYFAPLDDGLVMAVTDDVRRFEPAGPDRPHVRLYDAARASGLATFVSPDIRVARDLGVIDDHNEAAYLDVFGRLDEIDDGSTAVPATLDGPAAEIAARRDRLRERCDRLSVGTADDIAALCDALSPEQLVALAPTWITAEERPLADPDDLRAPSRLEAALADLFAESHRLRDE